MKVCARHEQAFEHECPWREPAPLLRPDASGHVTFPIAALCIAAAVDCAWSRNWLGAVWFGVDGAGLLCLWALRG